MYSADDEEKRLKKFLSEVDGKPYYKFRHQAARDAPSSNTFCAKEKLSEPDGNESYPACKNIGQPEVTS